MFDFHLFFIFFSSETTTQTNNDSNCNVTSVISKETGASETESREIDPFESIQEWLNRELGGKPDLEIRSDSPIFDDWDDINYDTDEEEDFDFLDTLQSPSSYDSQSIPGSEGYGTDTSDFSESLINLLNRSSESSNLPQNTSLSQVEEPEKALKKPAAQPKKTFSFTSSQTVASGKSLPEVIKPRIINIKDNRVQGNIPKGAKITRVYQIPTLNSGSTVSSKVGTQSRKTVVVKVLKPKNGLVFY